MRAIHISHCTNLGSGTGGLGLHCFKAGAEQVVFYLPPPGADLLLNGLKDHRRGSTIHVKGRRKGADVALHLSPVTKKMPEKLLNVTTPMRAFPQLVRRPNALYPEAFQTDVNAKMRAILVDWLVEVAEEYKLCADTLYLSVNYIDRFLSIHPVQRSNLQLVGIACMWIASKYEEIYPPNVNDFCYITDNTYTKEQMVEMEELVLKKLKYELTVPTSKTFLRRLLQ
eukprot:scaffold215782_cov15-Tisochrysis_lutea.AAC.1